MEHTNADYFTTTTIFKTFCNLNQRSALCTQFPWATLKHPGCFYLIRNNNLWVSGVLEMDIPSLGNLIHCIVVIDVTNFTDYTTIDNKSIMIPKVGIQPHLLYKVTATWCNICSNIIVALDGL